VSDYQPNLVRFGIFEVDLRAGELRRNGSKVKLQEQPFKVLAMLLEHAGQMVTREELQNRLWPADTFVDFDHSLNAAIRRLRDALGDAAESPRFVETVARRGYRFIAPLIGPSVSPREIAVSLPSEPSAQTKFRNRFSKLKILAAGLIVVCASTLLFVRYGGPLFSRREQSAAVSAVTNIGEKYTPRLSPDGQRLAFAWNGGSGSHFNLYVKIVGTEQLVRLTTKESAIDFDPVWSADGRYIAFCRILEGETGVYIIPAMGGPERRLHKTLWEEKQFYEVSWYAGRLSWSPDGKLLAFSDRASAGEHEFSIFLLSLDSWETRRLTFPVSSREALKREGSPSGPAIAFVSLHSKGDFNPAFSPDGRKLAFARISHGTQSIYTVPVAGGNEEHVISGDTFNWGLTWTSDGGNLVFASAGWLGTNASLWRISFRGGRAERLQFGEGGIEPSVTGSRLAYVQQRANITVWKRNLSSLVSAGSPERLIASTKMESGPQVSPDGTRIAFESTRSGAYEVWMCRSDGSGLIQLTHFNSHTGTPRWSPDGQQIVFDSRAAGNADIYILDSQGGVPHRLTVEPSGEVVPSWSRDGRWIYFASDRTGGWEVWKMPSAGGPAVQVTRHGGFAPFESSDGKFVYYAKGLTLPGLWRISSNGGDEVQVMSSPEAGFWGYWALVDAGIYYLSSTNKPEIAFLDLATRQSTRVFVTDNPPAREAPGLGVSPDGRTVLYTQLDALTSDIMVVDNFR